MSAELVHIDRDGPVAICRLDRPPANAIELGFAAHVEELLIRLLEQEEVGALVFTGTGSFFCGGLDLKVVPGYGREKQRALITNLNRLVARIYGCPIPVIGAINGHAIAGGFILAITCDYRVGTSAPCRIGLTEARVGIPFPAGAMAVIKSELRPDVARVMTLEARNVGPDVALSRGVLDELQPPVRVLGRAVEIARDMAGIPREAYGKIKRQLRGDTVALIEETVARGSDPMLAGWIVEGAQEASEAILRGGGEPS
jgi:enoyl-CoA hydratase/carnithine racemase